MKICFIADANSIHTHRWLQPLINQGHEITLISPQTVKSAIADNIKVIDLTKFTNLPKLRWITWGTWIKKYLREHKPNVLHAHYLPGAGWLGYLANYHPFILTSWGSDLLIEPNISIVRRFLFFQATSKCDILTVPSKVMYKRATELGIRYEKIRLIPWGVERDIFKPSPNDRVITRRELGISPKSKILLSPRGISQIYNIGIILEAFRELLSENQNLILILLKYNVDEDYLSELTDKIEQYQIDKFVRWIPAQKSHESMARLYRLADVTISIPSSEGYGLSVYEAISCGCATVITDLPVFEDELEDTTHTLKVPVGDPYATYNAIQNLLKNSQLKNSIQENSQTLINIEGIGTRFKLISQLYMDFVN